jgi:hypothetical protein
MSTFPRLRRTRRRRRAPRRAFLSPGAAANLGDLDDRALVDIGVARSEIASIEAEWLGLSDLTRRRIAAGPRHA